MESQKVKFGYERWAFDDFAEFIEEVERDWSDEEKEAWGVTYRSSRENGRDWYGTRDWGEALKLVAEGWENGREEFAEAIDSLTPYVIAALGERSEDLAPAGYLPNVPAFCAGSPACMHTQGETFTARTPVLRMLINIGGLGDVNAKAWIWRGAALTALTDYFEQIGTSVEIELVSIAQSSAMRGGKRMVEVNIPVKRASEHVEPDRLAFALGNPSMLRRFVFSLREKSIHANLGGGYGRSVDATPDADQVYFPKLNNFYSPEDALKHVLTRLMEFMEPELKARVTEDWEGILNPDSRAAY